jgi:hypothetical protein
MFMRGWYVERDSCFGFRCRPRFYSHNLLCRSRQSGKDIHELFDLIAGTSTGAILAVMVALRRTPLEEIEEVRALFFYCFLFLCFGVR